jgi:iron complex outermembrane receptor protein
MTRLLFVFSLLVTFTGAALSVYARDGRRLTGTVTDTTGAVLPGVGITVTDEHEAMICGVTTDDRGRYRCDNVLPGRYRVAAALNGFEPGGAPTSVDADDATVNFVLRVSALAEHVTVTATRTGLVDVQSTPAAVTALPSRTLAERGVRAVDGIAGLAPSTTVTYSTGGFPLVSIRGIGTNAFTAGADPSTPVYLDGVYLGRPAMNTLGLLDIERIEVLRGPQGTLYGRNSVGGAINIVSRMPTNATESIVRVGAGDNGSLRAEGTIGGPLVPSRLLGRVTLLRASGGGYVDDLSHRNRHLGSDDTWAGRGQLRTLFGVGGEFSLSGDYGRFDGVPATISKPIQPKPGFTYDQLSDLWTVRTSHLTQGRSRQGGAAARLVVPVGRSLTLTSLTAYRHSSYWYLIDADATELPLLTGDIPDRQHQTSEEVTAVGHASRLTWLSGLLLYADHNDGPTTVTLFPTATDSRLFPNLHTSARALFGQATYQVTARLSLTGGLRFAHEHKDLANRGGVYAIGTDTLANPATYFIYSDAASWKAWTPKAGLELRMTPGTFVYASATRGFKSGGFNTSARTAGNRFNPEFAWSYEAGVKKTMVDSRVRTNVAVFVNDYRDLQIFSFLAPGVFEITNAGAATIRGIELEGSAALSRRVQVTTSLSWLDATYDRYVARIASGAMLNAAEHRLNNAPAWSGSSSAVWDVPLRGGSLALRADASWQSRVYFTPANDVVETQGAYGLLHARVAYEFMNRHMSLAAYMRNITRQPFITGTLNTAPAAITAHPGEPRRWGTEITVR